MAAATKRPGKVIGMHFFNPAHVMKLVEIIPGLETSQDTIDDVVMFTESLRKMAVVVQECPGFLVNRLLMPYLNEATYVPAGRRGAARPKMDEALRRVRYADGAVHADGHAGHRRMPVCRRVPLLRVRPPDGAGDVLYRLVEAGRLGEKTGKGFYGYGDETDEPVKELLANSRRSRTASSPRSG